MRIPKKKIQSKQKLKTLKLSKSKSKFEKKENSHKSIHDSSSQVFFAKAPLKRKSKTRERPCAIQKAVENYKDQYFEFAQEARFELIEWMIKREK